MEFSVESSEKIVESYMRFCKKAFTIPNIKCKGNSEVDLLAINSRGRKFHIEISVSTSIEFARLRSTDYRTLKDHASQRRCITWIIPNKFDKPAIINKIQEYNFSGSNYQKVIVSNGWDEGVEEIARNNNILLWDIKQIFREMIGVMSTETLYFSDDILRLFQVLNKTGIIQNQ